VPFGPQHRIVSSAFRVCVGDRAGRKSGVPSITLSRSHRLFTDFDFLIPFGFFLAEFFLLFFLLAETLIKLRGIEVDI